MSLSCWHMSAQAAAAPAATGASGAIEATFDRSLLSGAGSNTSDLSRFERGNPVMPGVYNVDIFYNQQWIARRDIRFVAPAPDASARPCLDSKLLDQLGLRLGDTPQVQAQLADAKACVDIGELIPDATMAFDQSALRLDVSVPQAYTGTAPRGYVSPENWDPGITAGLLNYNFNSYRSTSSGASQTVSYLGLNAGLNIGLWQLREDATMTWLSASGANQSRSHWQNVRTYVQRAIPGWRALLTMGDSFTDGEVFDSFGIRGIQLTTDDRMLPDSLRGYAPVVRGVADSNALVTIRQNGVQLYQTTVAPGPFVITDLYPAGYGGNLDVAVTEADGRVRTFTVPYASVAQLLRPGTTRFSVALGQLRDNSLDHRPNVAQATIQRGINNVLTGYAGVVASEGYASGLIGGAINTRLGAVAFDLSQSRTEIPGSSSHSGQSLRISYSKMLMDTHTSLTVAAYRYSTSGYLNLTDAALARDYAKRGMDAFSYVPPQAQTIDGVPATSLLTPAQQAALSGSSLSTVLFSGTTLQRQRNRFDLTLSQAIGTSGGTVYVSGSTNDYWDRSGNNTQFQMGYNNTFRRVSFGFNVSRTRDLLGRYSNGYFLNLNIPLGIGAHSPNLMLNANHAADTGTRDQAMLNGTLGAANQFNYGVTASGGGDTGSAGSVNVGYRSPFALLSASYGSGSGYSQVSVGASGAIAVHGGGVTFGQPTGDTVAIIEVPGAGGARIASSVGTRVDGSGFALIPYLAPYTLNTVQVDPKGLSLDVQLSSTSAQVVPYAGAIVKLKLKTENGRSVIIRAHMPDGAVLPFGAEVIDEHGAPLGVVGQGGQILARGVQPSGTLRTHWEDTDGTGHACSFDYQLAARDKRASAKVFEELQVVCQPSKGNVSVAAADRNAP